MTTRLGCAAARRLLHEREARVLGPVGRERLERHLDDCAPCRHESMIDRALTAQLASLRVDYPYPIDVRGRVVRSLGLAARRPYAAEPVAAGQLGLAAATGVAAAIAVAVATGVGLEAIVAGARQLWMIADVTADALVPLARAALEVVGIPLRGLLRAIAATPATLQEIGARWLPTAIALTAAAYVGMGITIARVIARGFVSAPATGRHGRTA